MPDLSLGYHLSPYDCHLFIIDEQKMKQVEAMVYLRDTYNVSLRDAKEYVEALIAERNKTWGL